MDAHNRKPVSTGQLIITATGAFHVEDMSPAAIVVACYRAVSGRMELTRRIGLDPTIRTMRELADRATQTLLLLNAA